MRWCCSTASTSPTSTSPRLQVLTDLKLSQPDEIRLPLLWLAVLSGRVKASLAATTGVATADEVVKYLLVGADVVMTTSALLRHGVDHMATLLAGLEAWLQAREFASLRRGARPHEPAEDAGPAGLRAGELHQDPAGLRARSALERGAHESRQHGFKESPAPGIDRQAQRSALELDIAKQVRTFISTAGKFEASDIIDSAPERKRACLREFLRIGGGRETEIQHSSLIGLFGAMSSRRCRSRPMVRQAGFILRSAVGAGAAARWGQKKVRRINL